MIQIYSNSLGEEEVNAVREVFASKWLGKGSKEQEFVREVTGKLRTETFEAGYACPNIKHFITTNSCTEAAFQLMDLLEIKQGDEVVMPSMSFVGIANAVIYKGAKVIFCDVDPFTLNPSLEDLKRQVTPNTKAIFLIHYAGVPTLELQQIAEYCTAQGIYLIEDNANSPFTTLDGKSTGLFGDFSIWSFDSMKILVTGDGGLIYAKNPDHIHKLERQMYLGLETPSGLSNTVDTKWWQFEVSTAGRRSIMNDITAAIGVEQLKKFSSFISRRREIYSRYSAELKECSWITLPSVPTNVNSSYYMYHVQVDNRDEFAKYLRDKGIYTTFRYYPLHWVDFYKSNTVLPVTNEVALRTLCLPIHQNLTEEEVDYIIKTIQEWK